MRHRIVLSLFLVTAFIGPATAQRSQERGGVRTETMSRLAGQGNDNDLIWNVLGLLGLLGLIGLRGEHAEDSYHPAPLE